MLPLDKCRLAYQSGNENLSYEGNLWMDVSIFQGRKGGYLGHKLGMSWRRWEQWLYHLTSPGRWMKLYTSKWSVYWKTWLGNYVIKLWITFYQNNFIRILPSFFAQTKILNFTMGKTHGSYFNLLCQTPGSGKCFLKIPEFSYNFHFILRRIMW